MSNQLFFRLFLVALWGGTFFTGVNSMAEAFVLVMLAIVITVYIAVEFVVCGMHERLKEINESTRLLTQMETRERIQIETLRNQQAVSLPPELLKDVDDLKSKVNALVLREGFKLK